MVGIHDKREVSQFIEECVQDFKNRYESLDYNKRVEVNPWLVWKYFDILNGDTEHYNILQDRLKEYGLSLEVKSDIVGDKFTVLKE